MSFTRNVLIGGGACGALGFMGWTQHNSRHVPREYKGSLSSRMQEVALASFRATQIKDKHTAENHIKTVATLSSKQSGEEFKKEMGERFNKERRRIGSSYYQGYLQETLQSNDYLKGTLQDNPTPLAVFDFNEHLPVDKEPRVGFNHIGFAFSGVVTSLHDLKSRIKIISGNYIRCERAGRGPVLITGTTERDRCIHFQNDLLLDAAMVAASLSREVKIDRDDPISDTRVMDCNGTNCVDVGDLTSIPEPLKKQIRNGDFTVWKHYYFTEKSLSREEHRRYLGRIYVDSDPHTFGDRTNLKRLRYSPLSQEKKS